MANTATNDVDNLLVFEWNYFGKLRVPGINISLELLILILYPTFLIPTILFLRSYSRKSKKAALTPAGCRKLGLRGPSHVRDEYDSKYDHAGSEQDWKIKALFIHPVKSCAPVELDELEIEAAGPLWDRRFCIAELLPSMAGNAEATEGSKKPGWTFRTLRQPGYEKLALVKPEVWLPDTSALKDRSVTRRVQRYGALIMKYPNVPSGPLAFLDRLMIRWGMLPSENSFQVPLLVPEDHKYPRETIRIWSDDTMAFNLREHVPDDFRLFLGAKNPVTLFRVDPENYREVHRCAPVKEELGYQSLVGMADSYAVNLLNLASIHDVGNRIKDSIPQFSARRYRGNMLLTGPKAYDEDDWKRIRVSSPLSASSTERHEPFDLYCVCRTVRCRLPNVDPDTAIRHPSEPDKTMKSFRRIDAGDPNGACMGLQLVPGLSDGVKIKVGDKIEVVERGDHFYVNKGETPKSKR